MTVCRTDNVKTFQETIHLPYCFVVKIKSDVNSLAEASEVSYVWGWPAWSWMVCTPCAGICMVPSTETNWGADPLQRGWHPADINQLYIDSNTPATHIFLAKEENRKDSTAPTTKTGYIPSRTYWKFDGMPISHLHRSSLHLLLTSEDYNLCVITSKETFINKVLSV